MQQKFYQRGFSLLELLLYVGIAASMLLATSLFLSMLLESRVKNQGVSEVEQQGLQAMQLITQTIRNADAINSPVPAASAAALSLNTIATGLNPTVFDVSGGVIRITEGVGVPIALTNTHVMASAMNIQNLSLASTPGSVRVSFTLTFVNPSNRQEYAYAKTFYGSASLRQP